MIHLNSANVLCCLLSSPRPFVIGSGRFDRNCFRCTAGAAAAGHSSSSYRAGARERLESRRPRVRDGGRERILDLERANGGGVRDGAGRHAAAHESARQRRRDDPPDRCRRQPSTAPSGRANDGRGSAGREQNVWQLEPSSISETGWQLKEGGRREEKEDAQQGRKEEEGGRKEAV